MGGYLVGKSLGLVSTKQTFWDFVFSFVFFFQRKSKKKGRENFFSIESWSLCVSFYILVRFNGY